MNLSIVIYYLKALFFLIYKMSVITIISTIIITVVHLVIVMIIIISISQDFYKFKYNVSFIPTTQKAGWLPLLHLEGQNERFCL